MYGTITPADADGEVWRIVEFRKLTPEENRGKHNLYVNVLDPSGQRDHNPMLSIAWQSYPGNPTMYSLLNKPDSDIAHGNVDLYLSQTLTAWIDDDLPSDVLSGIHIRWPDEPTPNGEKWNTIGHHSFLVTFQRQKAAPETTNGDNGTDIPKNDERPEMAAILRDVEAITALAKKVKDAISALS